MALSREHYEQVAVVNYIDMRYPGTLYSASAGGMRTNIGTAIKMKAAGYKKGCPDLMIFEPRNGFKGLFIEMKAPDSKLGKKGQIKPEQQYWNTELKARGYAAYFCYGSDEAIRVIDNYFAIIKPGPHGATPETK